jgi:ribonucleoside-diphosphate reductase alpha chain
MTHPLAVMHEALCARLKGHSVVVCACRTPTGFLPCPASAQGSLIAVYPPSAYQAAMANPEPRQPHKLTVHSGSGYTGSICDQCGSLRMRRTGTCETCMDCGNAGGCG